MQRLDQSRFEQTNKLLLLGRNHAVGSQELELIAFSGQIHVDEAIELLFRSRIPRGTALLSSCVAELIAFQDQRRVYSTVMRQHNRIQKTTSFGCSLDLYSK